MATAAAEFNGVRPERMEIAEQALAGLRVRIARMMAKLNHDQDNPRWVEAQLRLFGMTLYNHIPFIEALTDEQLEKDVIEAIEFIDNDYRPSLFENRADALMIPEYAYVDVYEQLGLLPAIQCGPLLQKQREQQREQSQRAGA